MTHCKKALCFFCAAILILSGVPFAFIAAAEDTGTAAQSPLAVQIEMNKSAYFVTAKAKATVRVQNTGQETIKNVQVCAYSRTHLLTEDSKSVLLLPQLDAGETKSYSFEMVLNRRTAGVTFIERVLLFFAQLLCRTKEMQGIPHVDDTALTEEAAFRHGSAAAALRIEAWYDADASDDPDSPSRPQATYLQKYVLDILESGTYTMDLETIEDNGNAVTVTMYEDENNTAIEMPVTDYFLQDLQLPAALTDAGKIRFIVQDKKSASPKAFIAWMGGYCTLSDSEALSELINDEDSDKLMQTLWEKLEYRSTTFGAGYVLETYVNPEDNTEYNFNFSATADYAGITGWYCIDLSNDQLTDMISMRLTRGVTNEKAFTVSGREVQISELENYFS